MDHNKEFDIRNEERLNCAKAVCDGCTQGLPLIYKLEPVYVARLFEGQNQASGWLHRLDRQKYATIHVKCDAYKIWEMYDFICFECGSDQIETEAEVDQFQYGPQHDFVMLQYQVSYRVCKQCRCIWTDWMTEDNRAAAVENYLKSKENIEHVQS